MGKLISLVSAALALAACSNPTAPSSADRSVDAAKAKTALRAVTEQRNGRLASN